MFRRDCFLFSAGLVLACCMSTANATLIFEDDFEGVGNVVGLSPDGWVVVKQPANTSALIANFGNPGQSVHFLDNNFSGGGVTITHDFAQQTNLVFEYDILSTDGTVESVHPTLVGDAGGDWELLFLASGQVAIINDVGNFDDTSFLSYELNEWYHVTRIVDLVAGTGSLSIFQINDPSNGNVKSDANPSIGNTFFDKISLGTSGVQGSNSFMDNITIKPIPEPSSIAIWSVIGGIGLIAGYRKRRRKSAA